LSLELSNPIDLSQKLPWSRLDLFAAFFLRRQLALLIAHIEIIIKRSDYWKLPSLLRVKGDGKYLWTELLQYNRELLCAFSRSDGPKLPSSLPPTELDWNFESARSCIAQQQDCSSELYTPYKIGFAVQFRKTAFSSRRGTGVGETGEGKQTSTSEPTEDEAGRS